MQYRIKNFTCASYVSQPINNLNQNNMILKHDINDT